MVDDNAANRLLLQQQLHYLGHQVSSAENGEQAWQFWLQNDIDVVITDCFMPVMDGYTLARKIRAAEQDGVKTAQAICTIFGFTANAQQEEILRCRQAGMDDCLFKPLSLNSLWQRLETITSLNPISASLPITFDLAMLDQYTDGNTAFALSMVQEMIKTNQKDLAAMKVALPDQQWQVIVDQAHSIKGCARIANAKTLIAVCDALEKACRHPVDPVAVTEQLGLVEREVQSLESALQYALSHVDTTSS